MEKEMVKGINLVSATHVRRKKVQRTNKNKNNTNYKVQNSQEFPTRKACGKLETTYETRFPKWQRLPPVWRQQSATDIGPLANVAFRVLSWKRCNLDSDPFLLAP